MRAYCIHALLLAMLPSACRTSGPCPACLLCMHAGLGSNTLDWTGRGLSESRVMPPWAAGRGSCCTTRAVCVRQHQHRRRPHRVCGEAHGHGHTHTHTHAHRAAAMARVACAALPWRWPQGHAQRLQLPQHTSLHAQLASMCLHAMHAWLDLALPSPRLCLPLSVSECLRGMRGQ